jgi:signal transduction histidine kinase
MGFPLGFLPFIAFFIGVRRATPVIGIAAACAVSVVLCVRMWRRGDSVKVLEVGSLILFGAILLYELAFRPVWGIAMVRLIVDMGLLAIIVISLAIGKPFTLQYARETVPASMWNEPRFIAANRAITAVWAVAIAMMVAADAAAQFVPSIPIWVDVAVSVIAFGSAMVFTTAYPAALRRRAAHAASAERTRL